MLFLLVEVGVRDILLMREIKVISSKAVGSTSGSQLFERHLCCIFDCFYMDGVSSFDVQVINCCRCAVLHAFVSVITANTCLDKSNARSRLTTYADPQQFCCFFLRSQGVGPGPLPGSWDSQSTDNCYFFSGVHCIHYITLHYIRVI